MVETGANRVTKRDSPKDSADRRGVPVSPEFLEKVQQIAQSGMNPASALDLIGILMAEVPPAAKDQMELIKVMDTLIKTSRSMMETKLKYDDAAAIMRRLDRLEAQIEGLLASDSNHGARGQEIWRRDALDG